MIVTPSFSDNGYTNFIPPESYNTPNSVKFQSDSLEPQINVKNSWQYLKEYPALTESMHKAKKYWLSHKKYNIEKEKFESIRNEVPQEIEFLRKEVWKWHVLVSMEDSLDGRYHRSASDTAPIGEKSLCLYSKEVNVNRANMDIYKDLEIPDSFRKFEDYELLEAEDYELLDMLKKFPAISKEIGLAKKYWTKNAGEEEANLILKTCPTEVQRFRELLWKRHLCLSAARQRDNELGKLIWEEKVDTCKKWILNLKTVIYIATTFFFSSPYGLNLPSIILIGFNSYDTINRIYRFSNRTNYSRLYIE